MATTLTREMQFWEIASVVAPARVVFEKKSPPTNFSRELNCHLTPEIACISLWEDCSPRNIGFWHEMVTFCAFVAPPIGQGVYSFGNSTIFILMDLLFFVIN